MSIEKIPKISINGEGNSLAGGYIYDLNYNVSTGSEGSSTLTATVINEKGTYGFSVSDLKLDKPYLITIGSLHATMYPTRYRKKYSGRGNILEIEFTDGSFILDKSFIGLHKKHGWNYSLGNPPTGTFQPNPPCFIIIGREFHPCDIDNDGKVEIKDVIDPCHPCQQEEAQANKARLVDCQEMSKYNIFEVKYNFTELISQLKLKGFKFTNSTDPNPKYFRNHIGSVREVLSAWCHDFGWTFFWDNEVINFRDLRTVPAVNATVQNFCPNIEDYEEEFTLDGTFDKMLLTNFTRSGQDKDYDCYDAIYVTMPSYDQFNAPTGPLEIDRTIDYDAAGLAYYDQGLRNLYYLYCKYLMNKPEKYFPGKEIPELGLTILSSPLALNTISAPGQVQGGSIEPSTSLTQPAFSKSRSSIHSPAPKESLSFLDAEDVGDLSDVRDAINANPSFLECFKLVDPETQWIVAANVNSYFFFVGHYDPKVDQANLEAERDFAQNFMGKYHIYLPNLGNKAEAEFFEDFTFYDDSKCGIFHLKNDDRVRYEFLGTSGGDSLIYYNNLGLSENGDRQTLSDLPFAKFLRVVNGEIGNFSGAPRPFKLVIVEKNGQDFYPSNLSSEADTSSIFQNSGKNWLIQDEGIKNQAYTFFPKPLPSTTNEAGENVARLLLGEQANIDKNKVSIFLGYAKVDAFQYVRTNSFSPMAKVWTYFNGEPLNLEIDPITHKPKQELVYRYPEFLCAPLGESASYSPCYIGYFTTPVGQFKFYFPSYGSYACVLQKARKVLKRINKTESVQTTGVCNSGNTLELQVDPISITDDDMTKFLKIGPNSCIFNDKAISDLHKSYASNLQVSQSTPLIKKTFTIGGVTENSLGINDGLQNISITSDEQGIRSTYTFGTTHFLLPDPDVYSQVKENFDILNLTRANDINAAPQLKPKTV